MSITFSEAFAKYGATLSNQQWSFSAMAPDGAVVISCWQHKISTVRETGIWRYSDSFSPFTERNPLGKKEFMKHLRDAYEQKLPVRLVIVSTKEPDKVRAGEDPSSLRKEFDVREDRVGQVVSFDGDAYVIEFKKAKTESV